MWLVKRQALFCKLGKKEKTNYIISKLLLINYTKTVNQEKFHGMIFFSFDLFAKNMFRLFIFCCTGHPFLNLTLSVILMTQKRKLNQTEINVNCRRRLSVESHSRSNWVKNSSKLFSQLKM